MKYRPPLSEQFSFYLDGRGYGAEFFPWGNREHHHIALDYLTDLFFSVEIEARLSREVTGSIASGRS
jgi:hypothetical protein